MKQLANFSIESDREVLLTFKDGSKTRARKDDLPAHLSGPDLKQVQASFRNRGWFIRNILPPWARSVAIAVITLAVAAGSIKAVSSALTPPHHTTTRIATQSQPTPSNPVAGSAPANSPATVSAQPSTAPAVLGASTAPTPAPTLSANLRADLPAPQPAPSLVHQVLSPVAGTLHKLGL